MGVLLDGLAARIADAERRVAERDAAGYETPQSARADLAHARTEWALARCAQAEARSCYVGVIRRDLDRFDEALRAQHAADVGPPEDEDPQC